MEEKKLENEAEVKEEVKEEAEEECPCCEEKCPCCEEAEENTEDKKAKYVNPVLAWSLLAGEAVIVAIIALVIFL